MVLGDGGHKYELVDDWAQLPDGETFLDIGSVRFDADGNVLVLNRSDHPMMVFDPTGERLETWGEGHFSDRPHGMGLDNDGNVLCTDDGNHTVTKFAPQGEPLMTLGTKNQPSETGHRYADDIFERIASIDRAAGPFNQPTGVTVTSTGDIFVADGYGNACVHAFDPAGEHQYSFGGPGAGEGEFRLPHSIHTDDDDRLWVTDRENSRIQIFEPDGTFVDEWIDLIRPTGAYINGDTVYVSELCKRVSIFTIEGELLSRWGNLDHPADDPLFVAPHTIAVDDDGDVYVGEVSYSYNGTDKGARTIQKFAHVE